MSSYCDRSISTVDLARVHEHLYSCEICYERFLGEFEASRRFPIEIHLDELAGLDGWHLQGDELKNYVEGRLDDLDLALANMHLRECAWCREEAHHLSEFSGKLQYYLSKRHSPLKQPTLWQWRPASFDAKSWRPVVMARAAAFILLVLGAAIILWSVMRTKPEEQEVRLASPMQEKSSPEAGASHALPNTEIPPVVQSTQPSGSDKPELAVRTDNKIRESKRSALVLQQPPKLNERIATGRESEATLIAQNLVMPKAVEMFDRTRVTLRGGGNRDESFNVISPYATVITDEQPIFRWTSLSATVSYTVSVYDDSLNLIEKSEPLTATQWPAPRRLKRGVIYTWVVTALKDGKEFLAPELPARAEFKVIESAELIKLTRRVNQIRSAAARGVIYAKAGLLDKAEQEFRSHLDHYPTDEQASKLLRTVRSWREL
jgi:hypothetical protein